MQRARLVGLIALGVIAMMALPGCLVVKSVSHTQLNTIGDVRLAITICGSDNSAGSTCPDLGNSAAAATNGNGQALIGIRYPTNAVAPTTFNSTDTALTMTKDASYTAELQRVSPAPAGQQWAGYISQVRTFSGGTSEFVLQPVFQLQRGADGAPFTTPFLYRVVSGLRTVSASDPATRPVVCASGVTGGSDGGSTYCIDSPAPATVATNSTRTTHDLGIIATGAAASAEPGQVAVLNYQLAYSGTATSLAEFLVTASTTLPGATAAPNIVNFDPLTNQTAPATVLVNVPTTAAPGVYDVTLRAAMNTNAGQFRVGVGKLTVVAPPVPVKRLNTKVKYTAKLSSTRVRLPVFTLLGAPKGTSVRLRCVAKCSITANRTSKGKPIVLAGLFTNRILKPGVAIEVRTRKTGFIGRYFKYTFLASKVRTKQCEINAANKLVNCITT